MKNRLVVNKNEILELLGKEYQNLTDVVSDKFGIINAILERHELSKYDLHMYQCLSANTKDLYNLSREVSSGGLGVSDTKKGAMISCLAEALERYCMSYIPDSEVIFNSLNKLDEDRVFEDFYTYSQEQYQSNKNFLNPKTDCIHWTKICSVKAPEKWKYWPASLIYLPFELSIPVAENSSTGMAAGTTLDECILSGLLELIERDALMINFLQRLNPPEVDIDSIDGCNKEFLQKIKKDYSVKLYKLYSDIDVPIYLSLIWKGTGRNLHYGIGASANLNSDYAISKALKECLFTHFYSKSIMDLRKDNPKSINALYEHFLYYQGINFSKLLFDSKRELYKRQETTIEKVLEQLEQANIDVYYKELTTPDVKNTNLRVVKIIAPGLIDLNKSHVLPRKGAKRFWEVPKKLGLKCNDELSRDPHPFP